MNFWGRRENVLGVDIKGSFTERCLLPVCLAEAALKSLVNVVRAGLDELLKPVDDQESSERCKLLSLLLEK